jgi:hypothetical protein
MDAQEGTMDSPGRQHWNKEPQPEAEATSRKQKEIQHNLQEDHRAGDHEANSWIFCQTSKNEGLDTVEGSALLKWKEILHTEWEPEM